MKKKYKNTGTLEELILSSLKTDEDIKEWLTISFEEFIEDDDIVAFSKTLEYAIKAKNFINEISSDKNILQNNFYAMCDGREQLQVNTILKIIKELGYSLRIY